MPRDGGHAAEEIAVGVGISPETSRSHRQRLMARLNLHSTIDLEQQATGAILSIYARCDDSNTKASGRF